MYCDLHTHSTASDGTDSPGDLPLLAKRAGLSAIALTDHDTTDGLDEFLAAAKRAKIKAVPGIELSADPAVLHDNKPHARDAISRGTGGAGETDVRGTLHILGYFIQHGTPHLSEIESRLREARDQRNPQMITKLNELGMNIGYDEVIALAGGNIVGRPHIGQVLMQKGYVKTIHEAFARYIGQDGEAYVRKDRLSAKEAIAVIHEAGGLAVLAHPTQLGIESPAKLEHAVSKLKGLGLDGIEARHSDHTPRDAERFTRLAERLGILTTGGSDYHGSHKTVTLGSQKIPLAVYETLFDAHAQRPKGSVASP